MLKENIKSDMKEAMKAGNSFKLGVIRMVLAAFQAKELERRYKEGLNEEVVLSDESVIDVLSSEVKKRKDAIALYEKGGRPDLAEGEKKEIEIIQKYLPAQLGMEELKKLVAESIVKTGAKEIKDMGKVMADLNPKIKGKADGGEVSKIVKELLGK